MARRLIGFLSAALAVWLAIAAFGLQSARAQHPKEMELSESVLRAIEDCLAGGSEYVMPARACYERESGKEIVAGGQFKMPQAEEDWDKVCRNAQDPRWLPANAIKRLVAQGHIAPSGIRILGAVFCDPARPDDHTAVALDLAGLNLPYSLVIDHSVVNGHVEARNLRIGGDLSFDYAVILGRLRLNRAQVGGSVYGRGSFMEGLRAFDTQVTGAWQQLESIVFSDSQIVGATIAGDLNVSLSAFSLFRLQSSRIGGTLWLDDSEARCGYHIFASTVGYLAASHAGFGAMRTRDTSRAAGYPWWSRAVARDGRHATRELFGIAAIRKIVDTEEERIVKPAPDKAKPGDTRLPGCDQISGSSYLEFFVFDSTFEAAFCMTSFEWIAPKGRVPDEAHPVSIVALNDTRVNGNLILDLWGDAKTETASLDPRANESEYRTAKHKQKFEAIGLTAQAFIFAFSDAAKPYFTYLDGLKFSRIHKATPACDSSRSAAPPDMPFVPGLATQVVLPSVDEASAWLDKNEAPSSQPFKAFVQGFEQAGESTTTLRVTQMTIDLCVKTARWLPFIARWCSGRDLNSPGEQSTPAPTDGALDAVWGFLRASADLGSIGFQWILFLVADHGLRPAKVVWSIVGVILIFWCGFWFIARVVAFEPKAQNAPISASPTPWPITWLFLFDRLIPAYQIRNEHYSIARVFRRATPSEINSGPRAPGEPPYEMRYLGGRFFVWPLGDAQLRNVEKWLVILRLIGIAFAIFLVAAFNALVHS
jgi:hypothetical protein